MITKLLLALKKWALPLVVVYTLALTSASLLSLSGLPSIGIEFEDKIFHLLAYFIFTLLLYNYFNSIHLKHALSISVLIAVVYGIVIEILQYTLTTWRMFDVYDALANTLGAILASIMLKVLLNGKVKIE